MEWVMQTAQKHPTKSRPLEVMTPAATAHGGAARVCRRCSLAKPIGSLPTFLAAKSVTVCPTRYAAPVEQQPQFLRTGTDGTPVGTGDVMKGQTP
jgi:hypothetical protein